MRFIFKHINLNTVNNVNQMYIDREIDRHTDRERNSEKEKA